MTGSAKMSPFPWCGAQTIAFVGPRADTQLSSQWRGEPPSAWHPRAKFQIKAEAARARAAGCVAAISDMTTGVGLWWARAALDAGFGLRAYLAFDGQDTGWAPGDRAEYAELLSRASVVYDFSQEPLSETLNARTRAIASDCDYLVFIDYFNHGVKLVLDEVRRLGKPWTDIIL